MNWKQLSKAPEASISWFILWMLSATYAVKFLNLRLNCNWQEKSLAAVHEIQVVGDDTWYNLIYVEYFIC